MRSFYLRWVLGRPWLFVLPFLVMALGFASLLPQFRLASGSDTLILPGDDSNDIYEQTRDYFTDDDYILVGIAPPSGWSPAGVEMLAALTRDLEEVDGVESVLSPATVPLFLSRADGKLDMHVVTDPEVDLEKARTELTESAVYVRNVISDDGDVFNLLAYLNDPETDGEDAAAGSEPADESTDEGESRTKREFQRRVVGDVRQIMSRYRDQGARIEASGLPTVAIDMVNYIEHDIIVFGWAVSLFLLLALFVFFRKPRYVILPVVTCVITVVSILGLSVALEIDTTVVTSNISSLLFIIGMAHSIHIVVAYREQRGAHPERDHKSTLCAAMAEIWRPCWYTALTTCVGFGSLYVAEFRPVKDFAIMMALGVMLAFVVSMLFLPAALALLSPTKERAYDDANHAQFLGVCARVAVRHRPLVYGVSLSLLVAAVFGMSKLRVDTSFIDYFVEDTEVHQGIKWVDQIGGTMTFEVILPGGEDKFYWLEPENFERVVALHEFFDAQPEVGKTMSLASFERYARSILGALSPAFAKTPPKNLWKMLAFQLKQRGGDAAELERAVSMVMAEHEATGRQMTRAYVRIRETTVDLRREEFIKRTREFLASDPSFQGIDADKQPIVTGMFQLFTRMVETLVGSQVRSFGFVFFAVGLMLILLMRHAGAGMIAMFPNVLPIAMVLGTMGFAGITLDLMTIMIASVSLGIAADATIHYVVQFRRELRRCGDFDEACRRAHQTIGRAVLYTALTVIAGFFVLVLSKFTPTIYFGVLVGIAMIAGIVADLIQLPSLLLTFRPFSKEAGTGTDADADA